MRRLFSSGVLTVALAVMAHAQPVKDQLAAANAALQAGDADRVMTMLDSLPASAEVLGLKCRVQFVLEHWDAAVEVCQQAVNLDQQNSDDHLWLGRALGEKADRASFMSAYSLAKHLRDEFETAVRLNPRNAEAMADLGEFYASAPSVVGGGTEKAEALLPQLDQVDPVRGQELRARIADEKKDYESGERYFKSAIAMSQHPALQWMTLASFYRRRQRWDDLDSAIQSGLKAAQRDRHSGLALFNGSDALIKAKRNPALAEKMLEDYLASSNLTEEAPAFVAHTRLARLKAQLGDKAGASRERSAALALAHDYKPAQELKF